MLLHLLMHRPCFSLLPTSSCFPWLPLHFSHFFASLSVWSVSFCVCLWNSQTKTPIIFIKSLFTDFHLCFVFFFLVLLFAAGFDHLSFCSKTLLQTYISLVLLFCFVLMRSFLLWGWVCGWGLVSCCCSSCDMMLFFFFFLLLWLMSFSLSLLIIIITIIFSIWWCSTVCLLVDLLLLLFLGLFFEKIPYSLVFVKLLLCKSFGFMFTNPVAGAGLGFVCSFLFGLCEGVFASFWVVCWGCWLVQICDQFFTMVFWNMLSLSICGSHSCYNHEELGNEQTTWNTPTTHQELASCLYISFGTPGERERDGVLSSSFHPETQLYKKNRLKNLYYCWKLHSSSTQQGSLLNCRNEREREEEEKKQSSGGGVFSPRRV